MNILALDLGTKAGVCVMTDAAVVRLLDTVDTSPRKNDRWGKRFLAFAAELERLIYIHQPGAIAYEMVRRHLATDAAHIYGALQALVEMAAASWEIPTHPLPVALIKKAATGRGNADKTAMAVHASRRWPELDIKDDNQADALWIAEAFRSGAKPAAKKPRRTPA